MYLIIIYAFLFPSAFLFFVSASSRYMRSWLEEGYRIVLQTSVLSLPKDVPTHCDDIGGAYSQHIPSHI